MGRLVCIGSQILALAITSMPLLSGCSAEHRTQVDKVNNRTIVAGPGEKAFDEEYRLHLQLPIPEAQFVRLLKEKGLSYEVIGERGTTKLIVAPRKSNAIDPTKMIRQYQIYGNVDRKRRLGKMYWAWTDQSNNIVYIENAFAYTGP